MSRSLPKRKIGTTSVPAIGFGVMSVVGAFYPNQVQSDEARFEVLDAAYEAGCTHWDTADVYGASEELIGKWFKRTGKRNDIFLATKYGFQADYTVNGTPEYFKKCAEASFNKLGVDTIDLFYMHRIDSEVPIEITVGAMAEYVKAGRIRYLGLSECSAETLRRANKVHPIAAIQMEYSPFSTDLEQMGIVETCNELGVAIICYSPLGRGLLTGKYKSLDDFPPDDLRRMIPRFSEENFPNILSLADDLERIGKKYNASAGQIALAWVLARGDNFIPIPGTAKIKYLHENLAAVHLKLSHEDIAEVRRCAEKAQIPIERYPLFLQEQIFGNTPPLKIQS